MKTWELRQHGIADDAYTSLQMAEAADVSYRMLDHWTTKGYISPAFEIAQGSGTVRLWAQYQVGEIAYVKALKDDANVLTRLYGGIPVGFKVWGNP